MNCIPALTALHGDTGKLPFESAPEDDRNLPDMHLALYNDVVVFDSVAKIAYIICWVNTDSFPTLEEAYTHGCANLNRLSRKLSVSVSMPNGSVDMALSKRPATAVSNMTQEEFTAVRAEAVCCLSYAYHSSQVLYMSTFGG